MNRKTILIAGGVYAALALGGTLKVPEVEKHREEYDIGRAIRVIEYSAEGDEKKAINLGGEYGNSR